MVDVATQRLNMVESQVLPSDVTDRRILQAMRELPRERFAPETMAELAYIDEALPLTAPGPERRWLLPPRLTAKLLQLADISDGERVLHVGCGSGYGTAILARMAGTLIALESDEKLAADARNNLVELGIANVTVKTGSLNTGSADDAPFDVIVVEGAVLEAPHVLLDQLKGGGRLVAVVAADGVGTATQWRRLGSSVNSWGAFDAVAPVLPGFEKAPSFVF